MHSLDASVHPLPAVPSGSTWPSAPLHAKNASYRTVTFATALLLPPVCLMSVPPVIGAAGRLHIVVAFDQVGGIGKDGQIPWFLPPDLKRFKELTSSLPEAANPGTFNVVIMVLLKSSHFPFASQPFPPPTVFAGQKNVGFSTRKVEAFGGTH